MLDRLKALGMREGDTVRMYGNAFEYYAGAEEEAGEDTAFYDGTDE